MERHGGMEVAGSVRWSVAGLLREKVDTELGVGNGATEIQSDGYGRLSQKRKEVKMGGVQRD